MARFGLSPYANPIDAGIDTFTKLSNVFAQRDEAESRRMDAEERKRDGASRRELQSFQMQSARNTLAEQEAERPVKAKERAGRALKAEHELLRPHIESAMIKNQQALQNGTQPEYSVDEIDAILGLNKQAPLLDDDPQVAMGQVSALHNLQHTMAQIGSKLAQSAQQMPAGGRKVRISDQNAPGLVSNFNTAFGKLMNGREASSFLIDMDKGMVIPVLTAQGPDGKMSPLTRMDGDRELVHQIPLSILEQYVTQGASFGNLLLPALAQVDGDPKLQEAVMKAGETRKQAQAKARALEAVEDTATPSEARKAYTKAMGEAGYAVTPAEVKELFPDKEARSPLKVDDGGRDVVLGFDDDGGTTELWRGKPKPAKPEADVEGRQIRREERKEALEDKKASRASVKAAKDAWERSKEGYLDAEAAAAKSITGEGGKEVANTRRAEQNKLRRAYESEMQRHAEEHGETYTAGGDVDPSRSMGSRRKGGGAAPAKDAMPPAAQHSGKILNDRQTGKRYKSDGKSWNEIK